MDDDAIAIDKAAELDRTFGSLERRTGSLTAGANGLARAMGAAFSQAAIGGRALDDVLKGLALRSSSMAVTAAFRPVAPCLMGGFEKLFAGFGGTAKGADIKAAMGAIKPFTAGGVIGAPSYFPLSNGGVGLAGEAGPEAIMPLARGSDGRLGVAMNGGAAANVTIHIATPDAESFRRSQTYITGQIARAVARGQRSL
jgi:phage-related minor tail protein